MNPEVIERVREAWGITLRDGFGQTETTAQVGNTPGQEVRLGSMGRPLPGYEVTLLDHEGRESNEGEIALRLARRPLGLMAGYQDDPERTAAVTAGGYYRTGDEAMRDEAGYFHYVGRGDDVFKSSDYRLSRFELESVLLEHPAVAEVAVVPSPIRCASRCPRPSWSSRPGSRRARIWPATSSPFPARSSRRTIRRVELRSRERDRAATGERGPHDYRVEDFD